MAKTRALGATVRRSALLRLPMHPNAPSQGEYRSWMLESDRPLAIDLFSGAGGLSHGLEAAGYRVALAVDLDDWALETHAHNFEGVALKLDLGDPDVQDSVVNLFQGIDVALVAGGPPCQPYSRAGRSKIRSLVNQGARDAEDHRRVLWRSFLDIAQRIHPQAVLMENVPDMALSDDMAVMRHMLSRLEAAGYEADARIVDTWDYGVPQHRQRLVIVGVRNGANFVWPDPMDRVSLREAIGDLPVLDPTRDEVGSAVLAYDGPISDFQRRARKGCDGESCSVIYDHLTRAVRSDDLEAFRLMKPGTLYSDLPAELRRYRADIFDDKYNRLDWDGLSRSITAHIAKDGYWYIHPEQHRTLTVREAARIQTFPDHFRFAGARSHQFAQIGNAVPPAVGEVIGGAILGPAREPRQRTDTRPSVWRESLRVHLEAWSKRDRTTAVWAYPSDPWQVLTGLILDGIGEVGWPNPAEVLDMVPTLEDATSKTMNALEVMANPSRRRAAVQRLRKAAETLRADPEGWDGSAWVKAANLGPIARKWLDLLAFDGGGLAPSSSVLRVTARINHSDVDKRNRMSTGRMELAILVGDGAKAATVNAAMHRLGNQICLIGEPLCTQCPIRQFCRSASS
ncbi:DNA cytosine methyltransferase [Ferrimicrobium sp.]|uniref:DNA cytosine methyltransferase n=1 Tax=Ferrimicrobium sp. TaxID=2926050 RepID=UPI00260E3C37|nr:DNA cytosine methyltransferase [Ferrimicrobium sp.]